MLIPFLITELPKSVPYQEINGSSLTVNQLDDSETNRHKKRASNEALSNIPLYYLFQCECILLS